MQSHELWLKKLAKSRFNNGRWETDNPSSNLGNPFELLRDDLLEMLEVYNNHASTPIKALLPSPPSRTLITLLHGSTQLRLIQNEGYLDISLIMTRQFQTSEVPMTRLSPRCDQFGGTMWQRGQQELSTDQVIRNSILHLIETSHSNR